MESAPKPKSKRLLIEIASIIVAVIVVASVLFVYYSPDYSWSSAIRDRDGDGLPDADDAFPNEATEWADWDGDGVGDNADAYPDDPTRWQIVTPTCSLAKKTPGLPYGVKYEFVAISETTSWSDIAIQLSDGTNTVQWQPLNVYLDNGTTSKYVGVPMALGSLTVWCNITDLVGNGYVNGGDFLTFTTGRTPTFSAATTYTVSIIFEPTSSKIYDTTFTG